MSEYPEISVVIPFSPEHTSVEMLEEAKTSVEQQSIPTETVVVRDESQRGPAWARNRGLERANTRFVAFLDADDRWLEGKLATQLKGLRETGTGIAVEGDYDSAAMFARDLFLMRTSSVTSSIVIDTERVDIRFEEALERREDHLFVLESIATAGGCFHTDLVEIRKHEAGLSSRNTPALRIGQNERFVEMVAERVDEELATQYREELFRRLYHSLGRREHRDGDYRSALTFFRQSLTRGLSVRTIAAAGLSAVGLVATELTGDRPVGGG